MEPEKGQSGSAAERSEGTATTSGSVTANSKPNTNTVSSGIKLEKVAAPRLLDFEGKGGGCVYSDCFQGLREK